MRASFPTPFLSQRARAKKRNGHALLAFLLAALVLLLSGCTPSLSACAPGDLRVGLITDTAGIDGAESALIWQGLDRADAELSVCAQFIESRTEEDYQKNITALAEEGFDLVVAGPALASTVQAMAAQYPDTDFLLVDYALDSQAANVHSLRFRVDQAGFPAGYLAAAWADLEDPGGPKVGYVASRSNPLAGQYVAALKAGVAYYSAQTKTYVEFRGVYLDAGNIQDAGAQANALIDLGIDVILEVSDGAPTGAIAMAKGRGKWGIGADLDRYEDAGDARDILLTSVIKRLDNAAYSYLEYWTRAQADDVGALVGSLENGGVGLAPYHDLEKQIPPALKKQVADIQQAILEGKLDTGWTAP